jgi:hypothetical protein
MYGHDGMNGEDEDEVFQPLLFPEILELGGFTASGILNTWRSSGLAPWTPSVHDARVAKTGARGITVAVTMVAIVKNFIFILTVHTVVTVIGALAIWLG